MNQTIKGMFFGVVASLVISALWTGKAYAEWFNSKAPESDSSNLRAIRYSLEDISQTLKELVEVQKRIADRPVKE